MFKNLVKNIVPLGIGAAAAYTGASMLPGMSTKFSNLWASSSLTNKFKEKIGKEAVKKCMKAMFKTPSSPVSPTDYYVNFDKYLMELVQSASTPKGSQGFGELQSANAEAIAYAWQRRLTSYVKSGDIV